MLFEGGDGMFSHNACYREGDTPGADVLLQAGTLIVSNNRVMGGELALDVRCAQRHYSLLGNICRGKIVVEFGNPMPPPWAPLNLEGVV
jgi:hypothetical protein